MLTPWRVEWPRHLRQAPHPPSAPSPRAGEKDSRAKTIAERPPAAEICDSKADIEPMDELDGTSAQKRQELLKRELGVFKKWSWAARLQGVDSAVRLNCARMTRTAEALVNPELLVWARESAGLSLEDAAKKAHIRPERLSEWETGSERPTIAQLRLLGRAYHRPIAVFYLSRAPKKFQAMHDYRRLSGTIAAGASYELMLEIRRARDRREITIELLRDLNLEAPTFTFELSPSQSAEAAAANLRAYLGVKDDEQFSWRSQYEALNGWRTALEAAGILVFQATKVDIDEMRGFSFSELPLPVAVVNIGDTPLGRVFSLVHEAAHVALRESGLCDMVDEGERPPEEQRIEIFCNAVAAATLMPRDLILRDPDVRSRSGTNWSDQDIQTVARRFKVSREAFLRRMLTLGKTTPEFYRAKRRQFIEEYRKRRKELEGFAPPDAVAIARAGNFFTRLVLDSYHRERITSGDVSEYLDVKLKHLQKIQRAATGSPSNL